MEEAIRIIVEKCSPDSVVLAMDCLKAFRNGQRVAQSLYGDLLKTVFGEGVKFSPEERGILAGAVGVSGADERRSELLQVRLTPAEKAVIENAASAAGTTTSEFARRKLLEFQ